MNRVVGLLALLIGLVPMARTSFAQAMTLTGETKTVTATVEAIESASRTLTLKMPDGTFLNSTAPAKLQRFSEIRVGDQITTLYYENLVFRLKKPGEKDVNVAASASTPAGAGPTGTVAKQRTITATVTAIDRGVPVYDVQRSERLEVLVEDPGSGLSLSLCGWRQSGHHLDRRPPGRVRQAGREEVA